MLYARDTGNLVSEAQWVALLQSVAARDERALIELFEKTHGVVFAFISSVVRSRGAAEQLTVEVFYDVWRHAAAYDPEVSSVLGWVMSQARSKAIGSIRSSQYSGASASDASDTRTVIIEPERVTRP